MFMAARPVPPESWIGTAVLAQEVLEAGGESGFQAPGAAIPRCEKEPQLMLTYAEMSSGRTAGNDQETNPCRSGVSAVTRREPT
jgi:hypothetical protein